MRTGVSTTATLGAVIIVAVIAAGVFTFVSVPATAVNGSTADPGNILGISGTVEIRTNGSNVWRPLVPSDIIRPGDMVTTGSDGQLLVGFPNVGQVRIGEQSNFTVSESNSTISGVVSSGVGAGQVADPGHGHHHRFWLFFGKVWAKVQPLTTSDTYEAYTRTAVVGVRGTEFTVGAYVNGTTKVMALEGLVAVQDRASNSTVSLQANQVIAVPNVSGGLSVQAMLQRVATINPNSIDRWWEAPITTSSTTLATTSTTTPPTTLANTSTATSSGTPATTSTAYLVGAVVTAVVVAGASVLYIRSRKSKT